MKPITCDCAKGIAMCKITPCFGTPEQIEHWLDLGYAMRMMLDWETFGDSPRYWFICPATVGTGGTLPIIPVGQCEFLTADEKCELHGLFKPRMGAIACCIRIDNQPREIRKLTNETIKEWDSEEGRRVVAKWKQLVDYHGEE